MMKIIITESQYQTIVMEQSDEDNLQKVSNYVTKATRKKYPVVDEVIITKAITKAPDGYVNVYIYVDKQLEKGSRRKDDSDSTEVNIYYYVKTLITKFFGLRVWNTHFDSENFEYQGGDYK